MIEKQSIYLEQELKKQTVYLRSTRNWIRFIGWWFIIIPLIVGFITLLGALGLMALAL